MNINEYISEVSGIYKTGAATEHSYRAALGKLFSSISEDVKALNEPKRVKCGAPDFLINRGEIVVGHVEAKDIDKDLSSLKGIEADQKARYLKALPNLIYTNCLDFEFYREGVLLTKIRIADFLTGVQPKPGNFKALENQLRDFVAQKPQTITSSEKLAEIMAGKAVLIKDVLFNALRQDKDLQTEIASQYKAFQEHLIHDITPEDFADIYAETVAYGMFAARLHDTTLDTFTRQEALDLLPKSNPFLRSLFGYIAGHDLDDRIKWIIDDLADVFQAANVKKLMENFGSLTGRNDPFLHFYETFLAKYNPAKRKARGVWYTPEPVVNFIVRAVDQVLKTEFGLADGLADTSKVTIDWDTGATDKKGKPVTNRKEVHRVQILDPATGTGTFLAEVIKQIAPKVKGVAEGMWSAYIERDLIPRLHGFELLMASYAMCHMKLDMILGELGYKPSGSPPRLSVYLTNSLEEGEREVRDLFMAQWLTREAREANNVKRQQPIMCIIGNPPYSGHSSNKGDWINGLLSVYKESPALRKPAQAKWLSDDYVKFIRFSEYMIEKNGEGVLGFITNHSYLDNPTFIDMRRHLMATFDAIHVIDLHGSAKKKEVSPDGTVDKNVFDIQQGVAIIIAVKRSSAKNKPPAKVYHTDAWGSRDQKYTWLIDADFLTMNCEDVTQTTAPWQFIPRNVELAEIYNKSPSIVDFFSPNGRPSPAAVSTQDQFAISWTKAEAESKVRTLLNSSDETDARRRFRLCSQDQWNYARAKAALSTEPWEKQIIEIDYRPFDKRFTINNSNIYVHRRERLNNHVIGKDNVCLVTCRQSAVDTWDNLFVSLRMADDCLVSNRTKERSYCFPLYLYPDDEELIGGRRINLDAKLWKKMQDQAEHPINGRPDEMATFDYIYGVLHCPGYRKSYAEFLKADFPRVPWPSSPDEFWDIAVKGAQLRRLHLMEATAVGQAPFPFKGDGDAIVEKPRFADGKVWINSSQFFDDVPQTAWEFLIGAYQPAQKWLKDHKGRTLSFEDVKHYQRIIKVLLETHRIMNTITISIGATKAAEVT